MNYKLIVENWNKFVNEDIASPIDSTTVTTTTQNQTPEASKTQDKPADPTPEQKKQIENITKLKTEFPKIQKLFSDINTLINNISIQESKSKKTGDRCTRIAKRKYKVWPSAYASGAVVKCRQGKIWKGISERATDEEIDHALLLEELENIEVVEESKKKDYKPNFSKEKEQGLHGWFARNKGKGWINCRTGGPCGRSSADKKGGKYPACRPTKAQCKSAGKSPLRKKKSSKPISWTKKSKKD